MLDKPLSVLRDINQTKPINTMSYIQEPAQDNGQPRWGFNSNLHDLEDIRTAIRRLKTIVTDDAHHTGLSQAEVIIEESVELSKNFKKLGLILLDMEVTWKYKLREQRALQQDLGKLRDEKADLTRNIAELMKEESQLTLSLQTLSLQTSTTNPNRSAAATVTAAKSQQVGAIEIDTEHSPMSGNERDGHEAERENLKAIVQKISDQQHHMVTRISFLENAYRVLRKDADSGAEQEFQGEKDSLQVPLEPQQDGETNDQMADGVEDGETIIFRADGGKRQRGRPRKRSSAHEQTEAQSPLTSFVLEIEPQAPTKRIRPHQAQYERRHAQEANTGSGQEPADKDRIAQADELIQVSTSNASDSINLAIQDLLQARGPRQMPVAIFQKLKEQTTEWSRIQRKWPTFHVCGPGKCFYRKLQKYRTTPEWEYACAHCEERGLVCVRNYQVDQLTVVALRPEARTGESNEDGYWVKAV